MSDMTLPSRHRILNSGPGDLSPTTLPLGHGDSQNIESLRVSEEKHFVSLKLECQSGVRTRDLRLSELTALTTALDTWSDVVLKVIYHPIYSMNNFVTNKSKLPQVPQVFPYMG